MEVKSFDEINLTDIRLILLDLDNTLYSYKHCHASALKAVSAWCKDHYNMEYTDFEAHYSNARKKVHTMHKHTAAGHSRFFYFQFMFENILKYTDIAATVHCNRLYWNTFIENITLYNDASSFLNLCREKDIIICLVTDMLAEIQFNKIQYLNLENTIKFIVSSEEAGVEKPNPYIFRYAIEKSKQTFDPGDYIAVIGDNPNADIFQSEDYPVKEYLIIRDE